MYIYYNKTQFEIYMRKGDRSLYENYRWISLLNSAFKIYSRIVTNHIKPTAEATLLEKQSVFKKVRTCMDNVHNSKGSIRKISRVQQRNQYDFYQLCKSEQGVNYSTS